MSAMVDHTSLSRPEILWGTTGAVDLAGVLIFNVTGYLMVLSISDLGPWAGLEEQEQECVAREEVLG